MTENQKCERISMDQCIDTRDLTQDPRNVIGVCFIIVILCQAWMGCIGDSATKRNADFPPLVCGDPDAYFKADMILRWKVQSYAEHTFWYGCSKHKRVGEKFDVEWWLEAVNNDTYDDAPDAEIVDAEYLDNITVNKQVINGIPHFGSNVPNFTYDVVPDTRGIISDIYGAIPLSFLVGLPTPFDYIDQVPYPARMKMSLDFKSTSLSRLFGKQEVEIPFPIPCGDLDGKVHNKEGSWDLSFFVPVWSLMEHMVDITLETGSGILDAWVVKSVGLLDTEKLVNIPVVDLLYNILNIGIRIVIRCTTWVVQSDPCQSHNEIPEQIYYDYDYIYEHSYNYEYFVNSG